ncbi:Ubiquitin-60S ribosomal protein L40 [Diplonema papillatum]|nr:Ubiquitin-60S ribosomal protein L40 [Diplonema papillatum]
MEPRPVGVINTRCGRENPRAERPPRAGWPGGLKGAGAGRKGAADRGIVGVIRRQPDAARAEPPGREGAGGIGGLAARAEGGPEAVGGDAPRSGAESNEPRGSDVGAIRRQPFREGAGGVGGLAACAEGGPEAVGGDAPHSGAESNEPRGSDVGVIRRQPSREGAGGVGALRVAAREGGAVERGAACLGAGSNEPRDSDSRQPFRDGVGVLRVAGREGGAVEKGAANLGAGSNKPRGSNGGGIRRLPDAVREEAGGVGVMRVAGQAGGSPEAAERDAAHSGAEGNEPRGSNAGVIRRQPNAATTDASVREGAGGGLHTAARAGGTPGAADRGAAHLGAESNKPRSSNGGGIRRPPEAARAEAPVQEGTNGVLRVAAPEPAAARIVDAGQARWPGKPAPGEDHRQPARKPADSAAAGSEPPAPESTARVMQSGSRDSPIRTQPTIPRLGSWGVIGRSSGAPGPVGTRAAGSREGAPADGRKSDAVGASDTGGFGGIVLGLAPAGPGRKEDERAGSPEQAAPATARSAGDPRSFFEHPAFPHNPRGEPEFERTPVVAAPAADVVGDEGTPVVAAPASSAARGNRSTADVGDNKRTPVVAAPAASSAWENRPTADGEGDNEGTLVVAAPAASSARGNRSTADVVRDERTPVVAAPTSSSARGNRATADVVKDNERTSAASSARGNRPTADVAGPSQQAEGPDPTGRAAEAAALGGEPRAAGAEKSGPPRKTGSRGTTGKPAEAAARTPPPPHTEKLSPSPKTESRDPTSRPARSDTVALAAPPQKEKTYVYIKTLYGRTVAVEASESDELVAIKEKTEKLLGVPAAQQRLVYAGEKLPDSGETLMDTGVVPCPPPNDAANRHWRRGRGGVLEAVGSQILHLIVSAARGGDDAGDKVRFAAAKMREKREKDHKDTEQLVGEITAKIEQATAGGEDAAVLRRKLDRVIARLAPGGNSEDATLLEAQFDGTLEDTDANRQAITHAILADSEGYTEGKLKFNPSEFVNWTKSNSFVSNRREATGDDPYFHDDGASFRLNNVVKKQVNLDEDRNTSVLKPEHGEGVILGRSSLRPFNERMTWDTDIPLNVKTQLLGRSCPWIPCATARITVYDNPQMTVGELERLFSFVDLASVAENFKRIAGPLEAYPIQWNDTATPSASGGASRTKKVKARTEHSNKPRRRTSLVASTAMAAKRIPDQSRPADFRGPCKLMPTPRHMELRPVELQPGVVLLKGMMSIQTQQYIVDEAFRLGTNREGFSGGFYRVLEDGRTELNQGHRGQFGEDLRCFAPHFGTIAQHFLEKAMAGVVEVGTLPHMDPHWCNFNLYSPKSPGILWHRDGDETMERIRAKRGRPIISFSLGDSCEFRFKNSSTEDDKIVQLDSGDVLIFGGPSRNMLHSVTRLHGGTTPKLLRWPYPEGRLNLTYRHRN